MLTQKDIASTSDSMCAKAHKYGIINTKIAGSLDFSGVADIFVTN